MAFNSSKYSTVRHQNLIVKNPTIREIFSLITIARTGGKLKHTC